MEDENHLTWRMAPKVSHSDWTIEIVESCTTSSTTAPISYYHVHRAILAVGPKRSQYFERLFQKIYREYETSTSRIELDELSANAFPALLDYMYSRNDDLDISCKNAAALYNLSQYFDIEKLRLEIQDYWQNTMVVDEFGTYYEQAARFGNAVLTEDVLNNICASLEAVKLDSHLAQIADTQLWLNVVAKIKGNPKSQLFLCPLIADFCSNNQDVTMEVFNKLTGESALPKISHETAVQFLELEKEIIPESASLSELSNLQERCVSALAASWCNLDTTVQETVVRIKPLVAARLMAEIIAKAKSHIKRMEDNAPTKVVVSGAGLEDVNGTYFLQHSRVPGTVFTKDFVKTDGNTVALTLFCCQLRSGKHSWFISIPDKEQPGTDRDVDFYRSQHIEEAQRQPVPPKTDWVIMRNGSGSIEPAPTLSFLFD